MNGQFFRNVILKGLLLFIVINLAFTAINPTVMGKVSLYNHLFPGRLRFPFGEDSTHAYNLSLFSLDAMFSSHVISARQKQPDEYRVLVVGDSSIWGTLLRPEQTLAGQLNEAGLSICGNIAKFYNLGYPTISLTKDLMVLDYAMRYSPDMVIWPVTLEAFPLDKQLTTPIVSYNIERTDQLIERYALPFNLDDPALVKSSFWDHTLIGQRRTIADLLRLQIYGILWSATGIDQVYSSDYQHAQNDFTSDVVYHGMQPPAIDQSKLVFNVLEAGLKASGKIPVLLVNEPILIGNGKNSDIQYDFFYPRWIYDQWRQIMSEKATKNGWNYLDLWNVVPPNEFTNSAIHLTPGGVQIVSRYIENSIVAKQCK